MNETPTEEKEPLELLESEQLLLIPGHLFFIETIPIPEDLSMAEVASFAELSLESIAPFPVDQLSWGYFYKENSPSLILYATPLERLKKEGYQNFESYAWVLPDFAAAALSNYEESTAVLLESEKSIAILHFEGGGTSPVAIETASRNPEESPNFKSLQERSPAPFLGSPTLHLRVSETEVDEQYQPSFYFEGRDVSMVDHGEMETLEPVRPNEAALWRADLRNPALKHSERGARRLSRYIAKATIWAAVLAVALLLGELLLIGGKAWLGSKQDLANSQITAVARIADQQSLMLKLEQVAQNELRPIAMLRIANQIRLDLEADVVYNRVIIEDENRMTIEGEAGSVGVVAEYFESLRKSGTFQIIDDEYITKRGETTFTVTMDYKHRAVASNPEPIEMSLDGEQAEETAVQ